MDDFRPDEGYARRLDAADPLAGARALFHIPPAPGGGPGGESVYLCGNSLGLLPRGVREAIDRELDDWATLGVDAHLSGKHPWLSYHEALAEPAARLVGALPGEAIIMNSLTVNLHLMMVSFFVPTAPRHRIVVEDGLFPSDCYAIESQLRLHGLDPADALVRLRPREGERTLRTEDVESFLREEGQSVALLLLGAVNYLTGQWFDMERITAAAKAAGCTVGWDLAHAAGNVPMRLHDWGVDFAVWCSYKYLNSGPGAVGGAFIHERHWGNSGLPRLAGWWGTDPRTRFLMRPGFVPQPGAAGWQVSNPPILSMAPVRVSLEVFDRFGMEALREKSVRLTGYMERLLQGACAGRVRIVTPPDPARRGAQLSLTVEGAGRDVERALRDEGVVVDVREPNIIRAAPVPLYNTFHDVWRFVEALRSLVAG